MQRLLADNRLAEKAGWDREILAIELQALVSLDFEGPFAGSGTVMIAAERTGRRARALEIDCHYVDVAVLTVGGLHREGGRFWVAPRHRPKSPC
jgi:hypothetical protein